MKNQFLHLCTFKTPTLWAVMSERGDTDCAFSMCNGVKLNVTNNDNLIVSFAGYDKII